MDIPGEAFRAGRDHLRNEQRANILTHGFGALASLVGGTILVALAAQGTTAQLISAAVFALALVLLYSASTLYHSASDPRRRRRFKIVDHCAIYLLIAATYTPFTLVALRGPWGWSLFGVIWGLALAGLVFKFFFTGRFRRTSTVLYVIMGWVCLIAIVPLYRALPGWAFGWLLADGVAYTAGTLFYHGRVAYSHAIWHGFVLAGSACHFVAVCSQVVP